MAGIMVVALKTALGGSLKTVLPAVTMVEE